jgi:hypothetical protein
LWRSDLSPSGRGEALRVASLRHIFRPSAREIMARFKPAIE